MPRPTWSRRSSRKRARFCEEVLQPLNRIGDEVGCKRADDGSVATPPGFKEAWSRWVEAGWPTLTAPEEFGGQGLAAGRRHRDRRICPLRQPQLRNVPGADQRRDRRAVCKGVGRAQAALPAQYGHRQMDRHHEPHRAARRHRPRPIQDPRRAERRRQLFDYGNEDLHLVGRARPKREYHPPGAGQACRSARQRQGNQPVRRAQVPGRRRRLASARATPFPAARSKRRWESTATRPA